MLGATVTDVGPVVVTASFPDRRECRYVVSQSRAGSHGKAAEVFACRELLRDLCRGFVPMCGPGGGIQSPETVKQVVKAVRHLARTIDERARDRASSLRLRDLTTDDLKAFEHRLLQSTANGRQAWMNSRSLARLLVAVDDEWPGRVPPAVRQRCRFQTLPLPRPPPREPFSPFVTRQLRKACLDDMRQVTVRIENGRTLLASRANPKDDDGWREAANVLRAIDASQGTLTWGRIQPERARKQLPAPFTALVAQLYPSVRDLVPFLIMLGLQSGLPIECCISLRRDCLRNPAAGTVQIDHEKWRAGPNPFRTKRYPDGALNTPGGIVRAVQGVTERAADHSGLPWLFIAHRPGRLQRARFHHLTREQFVSRHGLVDDDGTPLVLHLSRLRKTRMTEWAKQVKGDPQALSRLGDHTLQVNWESYADVEAMRPVYEETIAAGLAHALDAADRAVKAKILTSETELDLRADAMSAAEMLGVAEEEAADVLDGECDTWLAACTGFERSPFAPPGSPCPEPFWGCLQCPNAVIQERKLPAILAALDAMVAERARMDPKAWRLRFGRPFLRIVNDVIPAFGTSAWERARQEVSARSALRALPAGVFDG
ncbi:MAG: hypothetical protein M3O70_24890 [Actinomycetota bacterium]|nr:hypothetical protein [Actinomycetota bacterium]